MKTRLKLRNNNGELRLGIHALRPSMIHIWSYVDKEIYMKY